MTSNVVGVLCLVAAALGILVNVPNALVSFHQIQQFRAKGHMRLNLRSWAPILTLIMCVIVGAVGVAVLVRHPKPPQQSTEQIRPAPVQEPAPTKTSPQAAPAPSVASPVLNPKPHKSKPKTDSSLAQAQPQIAPPPSVSIPGTVTQSTNAPCSGNSITGGIDNTGCTAGYVAPPAREMSQANTAAAIAILDTAEPGSTVDLHLVGAGNGDEIMQFMQQIGFLFGSTHGVWKLGNKDRTGQLLSAEPDGTVFNGAGFHCAVRVGSHAAELAVEALTASGYPCEKLPHQPREGVDIELTVGTRVVLPH